MANRKQQDRLAVLSTPLGKDVLLATRFEGHEALSTLFEFTIGAASDEKRIDFKKAIGRNCALKVTSYGVDRYFNGTLVEARWSGVETDIEYSLTLRPWLWLLTQTSNCKIFVNKSAPDIIKEVFKEHGFQDYKSSLNDDYPVLEYCVQYSETDFSFVSRLMEAAGIYYYFSHTADSHTMELIDATSSHPRVGGEGKILYRPGKDSHLVGKDHFHSFAGERRLASGKVTLTDYDFMQPSADLKADKSNDPGYTHSDMELFHYPGKYPRSAVASQKKRSDGKDFATVRLKSVQTDQRRYAEGDAIGLFAGGAFTFKEHPDEGDYVVVRAHHVVENDAYGSGGSRDGGESIRCDFDLMSKSQQFKAPLVTSRPVIGGPQTAKVVCKNGEEIDVDEYGRVLVRFFWDRVAQEARRVRVAQMLAGAQWGCQFIPRVDQEVVVEFLEGDPDKPLIVGTLYNAKMKLPYELPANKTMLGIKSNSSKGGGGYNEFVFDDKKSNELVRMQAQRDYQVTVLNSETRTIGKSFEKSAKGDPSRSTTLKKGDDVLKIDQGNSATTVSLGDQTVDVTAGNQTITVGKSIAITANLKIELTVGPSKITIDPTGITIKAPLITLEGAAMVKAHAPMVQINADGVLTLKGGMTLIN